MMDVIIDLDNSSALITILFPLDICLASFASEDSIFYFGIHSDIFLKVLVQLPSIEIIEK